LINETSIIGCSFRSAKNSSRSMDRDILTCRRDGGRTEISTWDLFNYDEYCMMNAGDAWTDGDRLVELV